VEGGTRDEGTKVENGGKDMEEVKSAVGIFSIQKEELLGLGGGGGGVEGAVRSHRLCVLD